MTLTETAAGTPVNISNFVRAETDLYFSRIVQQGGLGRFVHYRDMTNIDSQDMVRMNRDTIYSSAVFDLEAGPVTIALPSPTRRFMSMQVITQDHFTLGVFYPPAGFTCSKAKAGTRYIFVIVRTLADPRNDSDMDAAHSLQDAIQVEQASIGHFQAPHWDRESQAKVRDALNTLGSMGVTGRMFGTESEVDPIGHLIGTAIGWGGNPRSAAIYEGVTPLANDGRTTHILNVKEVPVEGFWSISVYNQKGYFERNSLDAYSLNNLTAKPNLDGSYTIQFGGCERRPANCLPIIPNWNYTVRLYRPRKEILDGTWKFPEAKPI
jgi:para-nitrobenzyl esterase